MRYLGGLGWIAPALALAGSPAWARQDSGYRPTIAEASPEAKLALGAIRTAEGIEARLFAAEPMLANPVAFAIDERGRFFVCETFRHSVGATDNRSHMNWLDDDLAARTVADRVAMFQKHLGPEGVAAYQVDHDRLRRIEDRDGDGQADRAEVFADGFNGIPDGIGSGVLARKGTVYYACIPSLWRLDDPDDDGHADARTALQSGYGVHVAFLGHDLHGLAIGFDGKLYFSIGDRGANVPTPPDGAITLLDSGGVFRCNPDGSGLELVASGMRNPQELAFDEFGNLFTGENNSDAGDAARWVQVLPGGDSGWRIGYQYMETPVTRGPWHAEKLWHLPFPGQATYVLPPIAHLGNGPSGITYHPGVAALPDRYKKHFFMCDFKGGKTISGVHAFRLEPKGAGFAMVEPHEFLWGLCVTDVDFGPDGALYVTDWVDGWSKPNKGRIYKFDDPAKRTDRAIAEVKGLIAEGFEERSVAELSRSLAHADMRIRREAQFALVARGVEGYRALREAANGGESLLTRLHGIWGLRQLGETTPGIGDQLVRMLDDDEAEIRAQAAWAVGEMRHEAAAEALIARLQDESPRVRMYAALSLGRLNCPQAAAPLAAMLAANDDRDPVLRHAGVMGLLGRGAARRLHEVVGHESAAVRKAVAVALRRERAAALAAMLDDSDPLVALEAARGIYDETIVEAMPALATAKPALTPETSEPFMLRVVAANARVGGAESARRLAELASSGTAGESVRLAALTALHDWTSPIGRDPVTGLWRPAAARDRAVAAEAFGPVVGPLLGAGSTEVRALAVGTAAELGLKQIGGRLPELVNDRNADVVIAALRAARQLGDPALGELIQTAGRHPVAEVRGEALGVLSELDPAQALPLITESLADPEAPTALRQAAAGALETVKGPEAERVLQSQLERLEKGELPADIELEMIDAANASDSVAIRNRLAKWDQARADDGAVASYRECLQGGDPGRGRNLVRRNTALACLRCHVVEAEGGEVGPNLAGVAKRLTREQLLESIVAPDARVAEGFETVVLVDSDGVVTSGVLKREDDQVVTLATTEGKLVEVEKSKIEERTRGVSAMPADLVQLMSRSDLRDIVSYLCQQH